MNGNPAIHAAFLGAATLLVVPFGAAMLCGRAPRWVRKRASAAMVRARGVMLLFIYVGALLNGLPRMAGASQDVVLVATIAGGIASILGFVVVISVDIRERRHVSGRPRGA
jgi:anti-sigma factor RsiW